MAKKPKRTIGEIMFDMEDLLMEMTHEQDLQWNETLNLVRGYLEVHCPEGQEEYVDGGSPVFYYGPVEGLAKFKNKKQKNNKKVKRK